MNGATLNFHYDFLTSLVLNDPEFFTKKVPYMKAVGVKTVWLDNYIYGMWQNTPEEAARAKAMLETEGFEVQACKSGYVAQAQNCLVSYGTNAEGRNFICVIARANNAETMMGDHRILYSTYGK